MRHDRLDSVIEDRAASKLKAALGPLHYLGLRNLISRLNFDLYHGPLYLVDLPEWPRASNTASMYNDGAYPFPFVDACDELRDILDEHLSDAEWFDTDAEDWSTSEPEGYWANDDTAEFSEEEPYDNAGWYYIEPDYDYTYQIESTDFWKAILGTELYNIMR